MSNRRTLFQTIKEIAVNAMYAEKPADFIIGEVTSVNPLKIRVTDKTILPAGFFIVSRSVTNYIDNQGREIDNCLQTGDSVILARKIGGKKFIVLDKEGEL